MDKRTLIGMLVMLAVFAAWELTFTQVAKRHPEWVIKKDEPATPPPSTTPSNTTALQPGTTQPATQGTSGALTTAPAPTAVAGYHAQEGKGTSVVVGSIAYQDPTYAIGVSLAPRGAAIERVTLNALHRDVRDPALYTFQQPYDVPDSDLTTALATRWVKINGTLVPLNNVDWDLQPGAAAAKAVYSIDILDNLTAKPAVRVLKTFEVKDKKDPSQGYQLAINYSFVNLSGQPLRVQTSFNGTNSPESENRNDTPSIIGGYNDEQSIVKIKNLPVAGFTEKQREVYLTTHYNFPFLWVGTTGAYFDALVQPDEKSSVPVADIRAFAVNPGAKTPSSTALQSSSNHATPPSPPTPPATSR